MFRKCHVRTDAVIGSSKNTISHMLIFIFVIHKMEIHLKRRDLCLAYFCSCNPFMGSP
jgi:hypothetical protein